MVNAFQEVFCLCQNNFRTGRIVSTGWTRCRSKFNDHTENASIEVLQKTAVKFKLCCVWIRSFRKIWLRGYPSISTTLRHEWVVRRHIMSHNVSILKARYEIYESWWHACMTVCLFANEEFFRLGLEPTRTLLRLITLCRPASVEAQAPVGALRIREAPVRYRRQSRKGDHGGAGGSQGHLYTSFE